MKKTTRRLLITSAAFLGAAALGFALPSLAFADTPSESAAESAASGAVTSFKVDFTGSLFIFPLGNLTVQGAKDENSYFMRADMETAGLGKIAKDEGLWSTTRGYFRDGHVRPLEHVIQKLNEKGRRVDIDYRSGSPATKVVPPFGSMGVPPASEKERTEAVDALSAVMQFMSIGYRYGDTPCAGSIPVFDGKQRYNLNLKPAGRTTISQSSYKGEVIRCDLYMENVSGYDPEDLLTKEEAETPLQVYLAPYEEAGMYIPVRFDYRVSGIRVNIRATHIDVKTSHGG